VQSAPLSVHGKFEEDVVQSLGLRGLLGAALGASIGQATNTPGEWGQGAGAYGERFASSLGGSLSRQTFSFVLESVTHEDPRYFPSTARSKKARLWNVMKQTFITRTDSGGSSFAYSTVISAFAAGQLVNTWQPKSTGGVSDGIERGFITLGLDAASNLMQEFVTRLRPRELRKKP
jgi:hypothetical protein